MTNETYINKDLIEVLLKSAKVGNLIGNKKADSSFLELLLNTAYLHGRADEGVEAAKVMGLIK